MRKTGTLRDAGRAAVFLPVALGGLLVLAAGVTVAAFKFDTALDRLFSVGALGCILLFFGWAVGGGRAGLLRKLIGWTLGLAGVGLLALSAMPDRILANLARALGLL